MPLNFLFQDDSLLVIDKPPGLVVTPAESVKEITLSEILQTEYGIDVDRGGVVHRLDKDTSGIIIAAKTQSAFATLQSQFKERTVQKTYLALVHGLTLESGTIEGDVGRNPGNREKFTVLEEGKEATTHYQLISHYQMSDDSKTKIFFGFNKLQLRKMDKGGYSSFSLVKVFPKTGRTHQIRVHFKFINHPLVADEVYSGRKTVRLDNRWCPRQFLHAQKIEFDHPVSGSRMTFESSLPQDLEQALACLETTK